jgi:hypothetical protein
MLRSKEYPRIIRLWISDGPGMIREENATGKCIFTQYEKVTGLANAGMRIN